MKKTSTILAIGSALALGSAQAEVESSFHVGYSTDYIFRGINQAATGEDNNLYEYGIDFSGDCNCGATWNAGVWRADFGDSSEETDVYASISKEFGAVGLTLGLIRYDYGNETVNFEDTTEVFLGASTNFVGLDLNAVIFYDVDANDGALWTEFSVGKSYDVAGATLSVTANYGFTLDADDGDDYTTYGLRVALSKELGDNLTGSVYVAGEITDGTRGDFDEDDLYGGISLSYGF